MNDFQHIFYNLDPAQVALERKNIPFKDHPLLELVTEFAYAKVILLEREVGGRYLYLSQADLLGFMLGLEQMARDIKSTPEKEWHLQSMYQLYSLKGRLVKEELIIEDTYNGAEVRFKLSYYRSMITRVKKRIWKELLLLYPEMRENPDFGKVEDLFY